MKETFKRRIIMAVSYDKLWKLLIDKKMSAAELRRIAEIAPNTMTRMRKNQEVTMSVLEKICDVLDADFGDIVEYMGSQQTNKQEVRRGAEK
ncbi:MULTISPECIES: helix-turn-helix domain-containing protein [Akkermansia]|jgi:putative transcriptional regulator|nr:MULTISPECIES: helix-turn-helix transcriptional regulator [Akkermansia]QWP01246.1 helix-turn-helix transcriptional regulator [Akkermansia muciniphila]QWP44454.1 helix-turn-helix transcriptional regulator [Akkermansia muciniphila]WMB22774.1 helix-turn-helix transcriptional regulator [Akkermansia muciniphila]